MMSLWEAHYIYSSESTNHTKAEKKKTFIVYECGVAQDLSELSREVRS